MASVQANISGVAKNNFACCSAEPMELLGWAMTSAAMPAFQHMPSERRTAVKSIGNAEVIAQPRNSIGSALQQAKLFFATPEMFAWTLAIILLSVGLEKLVVLLITAVQQRMEGEKC